MDLAFEQKWQNILQIYSYWKLTTFKEHYLSASMEVYLSD